MPGILEPFPATHLAFAGADTAELGDLPARADKSMQAALQDRAAELGVADRVQFTPSTLQQMADLYAAADVVVVPSWEEPFGLVVAEAMAAGTAVVGASTGAIPEIIEHGESGLLVQPRQPRALADAIGSLLADSVLRQRLANAGQARVRRLFTIERYCRDFESVVRVIVARRQRWPASRAANSGPGR
jgi:glycosyltransferase involved in cell wall biosynthesis